MAVFGNSVQLLLALVLGSGSVRSRYAMLQGARQAVNQSASRGRGSRLRLHLTSLGGMGSGQSLGPTYTGHDDYTGTEAGSRGRGSGALDPTATATSDRVGKTQRQQQLSGERSRQSSEAVMEMRSMTHCM